LPISAQAYRVAANAQDRVTTQGFSVGMSYYLWQYYVISGNYSWNKLNTASDDPIIPAFNTPRHLVADVGVGQLVYGTDYPYDWPVGIDFILNAPFLSNADKEAVLGGNASRLLRIA
jgi:predicted TIM-barrel fold metal-dependent hydrolase